MVLKEAFREQNFLDDLICQALRFISREENVVSKKQEHMRKASNPDAIDEVFNVPKITDVEYTPNDVINFVVDLIDEKEKLTRAIAIAKSQSVIDIDSSISMNKTKQNVSKTLKIISEIKGGEKVFQTRGRKFNVNGDETNYTYDVKETIDIDFDRKVVKGIIKRLNKESDDISTKIDKLNVSLEVDYESKYEIGDSLDDCISEFKEAK